MAHRHGMTGRMLAMALAMIMIVTSLPQTAMTAYAAENVEEAATEPEGAVTETSNEDVDQSAPENEVGGIDNPAPVEENNGSGEDGNVPADETEDPADGGSTPADEGNNYAQNEETSADDPTPAGDEENAPAEDAAPAEGEESTPAENAAPAEGEESTPAEESVDASDAFEDMEGSNKGEITDVELEEYYLSDTSVELYVKTKLRYEDNYVTLFVKKAGESGYKNTGKSNKLYQDEYEDDEENWIGYDYCAAWLSAWSLESSTSYVYKVILTEKIVSTDEMPDDSLILDYWDGEFTTKAPMKSLVGASAAAGIYSAEINANVDLNGYYGNAIYLYVRYCEEKDDLSKVTSWKPSDLSWYDEDSEEDISWYFPAGSYSGSVDLTGLAPETSYKYEIVATTYDEESGVFGRKEGTFTTGVEARKITGASAETSQTTATVNVTFEGSTDVDKTEVHVYYRKKTDPAATFFDMLQRGSAVGAGGTIKVNITGLDKETTYEYVAVLWKDNGYHYSYTPETDKDNILSATSVQEFTTKAEGRKLGTVSVEETFTQAKFEAPFSGSYKGEYTFARVYYREKGKETGYQHTDLYDDGYYASDKVEGTFEGTAKRLAKETEYEYIVVLSSKELPYGYSSDDLKLELGSEAALSAGILDKKTGTFKTKKETREITKYTYTSEYTSAKVTIGFTGSIKDEATYFVLYYREKDAGKSYQRYGRTKACYIETHSNDYTIADLKAGTTYEAVYLISDQNNIDGGYPLPDGTKIIAEEKFEFKTQDEGRKLVKPAIVTPGYAGVLVRTGYEGNIYGDYAYLYFCYRTSGTTGTFSCEPLLNYSSTLGDYTSTSEKIDVTKSISLSRGTKYEYAIVFSDTYLSSLTKEELDKIGADWIEKGTEDLAALEAEYDATVTYNEAKSIVGHTVLDVAVTGDSLKNKDSVINAQLHFVRVKADGSKDDQNERATVSLKDNAGYKGELATAALDENTEYIVTEIALSVVESGNSVYVKTLTKDGDGFCRFTTKVGAVPTQITLDATEAYLNVNVKDYDDASIVCIPYTFSPADACTRMVFSYDDDTIVRAGNRRFGDTPRIVLYPKKVGEATVKVASELAPDTTLAEIKVTVKDYKIVELDDKSAVVEEYGTCDTITVSKGDSKILEVREKDEGGNYTIKVSDVSLVSGQSVVSFADGKITGENIGKADLVLKAGNYFVESDVRVIAKPKGFLVKELRLVSGASPAIIDGEASQSALKATVAPGCRYQIDGYFSPSNMKLSTDSTQFTYEVTKGSGVTVAGNVITIGASDTAYEATVTVTPAKDSEGNSWTTQGATTITLNVAPLPKIPPTQGYVLANVAKTLGDVKLDDEYKGWEWIEAAGTPLFNASVAGGTSSSVRDFEAKFTGTGYYPVPSQTIRLHVITMTSVTTSVFDKGANKYNDVLLLKDGKAAADLTFYANGINNAPQIVYSSLMGDSKYKYVLTCTDKKASGVSIGTYKDAESSQTVEFSAAGTYHFKVEVKSASDKLILSGTRTITVVDKAQVYDIKFTSATYEDKTPVTNEASCLLSKTYTVVKEEEFKKGLILTVKATDIDGKDLATALEWKSSDPAVAKVSVDSTSRIATIKPGKEQGHTMITVTAKDSARKSVSFRYEYQNRAPRVEKKALKINLAYDTDTAEGEGLAYAAGSFVEIAPVYGDYPSDVALYVKKTEKTWDDAKKAGAEKVKGLRMTDDDNDNKWLVETTAETAAGKYNCWMVATVYDNVAKRDVEYGYPMTITAFAKRPTLSVKTSGKINLFYINRNTQEYIQVGVNDEFNGGAPTIGWKDDSSTAYGFTVASNRTGWLTATKGKTTTSSYAVTYENVKVDEKGKLVGGVDKGTVTVTLPGIRKAYGGVQDKKAFKIATLYKKPVLATTKASSSIARELGIIRNGFTVINKTESKKKDLKYVSYATGEPTSYLRFTSIAAGTDGVKLIPSNGNSTVAYDYTGSKKSVKVTMTLDNSKYWREPLTLKHTIKNVKPKAAINMSVITVNTSLDDMFVDSADIALKMDGGFNYDLAIAEVDIKGANAKAQTLVDDGLIDIYPTDSTDKKRIKFNQYAAKALGKTLAKGTYKFQITPYYKAADGQIKALNKVTLSIKVVDKYSVKTTAKGSLDTAKLSEAWKTWKVDKWVPYNKNVVKITSKPVNIPTGARLTGVELKGQYADHFSLYYNDGYYIGFRGIGSPGTGYSSANNKKLRAGTIIPLSIDYTYTVAGTNGNHYAVVINGDTFKVKITQSVPKVKVTYPKDEGQILYEASGADITRIVKLTVPDTSVINTASGSLDCNKDGKTDITVTYAGGGSNTANVRVKIVDKDAVFASAKGKTLSIPVTVIMQGSDGVAKNSTVTIKVKVKR